MKILLLSKNTDYCKIVQNHIKENFSEYQIIEGENGDPFPALDWSGDYLISFLSPWIIPEHFLTKAKYALNFHPAPPKYPGTGCYNFAIYNQENEYGATCHHMESKVDTGNIIQVKLFPMYPEDTVYTLKNRTMDHMLQLFYEILDLIKKNQPLPTSELHWQRLPYKRKELVELCRITKDMSEQEISRRLQATYFPGARDLPFIEIVGKKFILKE